MDNPVGAGRDRAVVGHQQDRDAAVPVQSPQELHHLLTGLTVQVAGWLVGQDQLGLVDQRAGYGHPLLFAAGELAGQVMGPGLETDGS